MGLCPVPSGLAGTSPASSGLLSVSAAVGSKMGREKAMSSLSVRLVVWEARAGVVAEGRLEPGNSIPAEPHVGIHPALSRSLGGPSTGVPPVGPAGTAGEDLGTGGSKPSFSQISRGQSSGCFASIVRRS